MQQIPDDPPDNQPLLPPQPEPPLLPRPYPVVREETPQIPEGQPLHPEPGAG